MPAPLGDHGQFLGDDERRPGAVHELALVIANLLARSPGPIVDEPRNRPSKAFPHRYDGVAEVWFKDQQHLDLWFDNSTPEAKAAGREIRADERKFADRARSPFIIAESIPIIEG